MTRLDDLRLTAQEPIYLAAGARMLALQARKDCDGQTNPAMQEIFASAERTYLELAAKVQRMG
jgi:hypothetical protein